MRHRTVAAAMAAFMVAGLLSLSGSTADTEYVIAPSRTAFAYNAGPFTHGNVGGLLLGSCLIEDTAGIFGLERPDLSALPQVPQFEAEGCVKQSFRVAVPPSYYANLRRQGRTGVVQITMTWENNDDDFDLVLLGANGDPIATSGFGNSTFERIAFTELASGTYTIQSTLFRVVNASFHVDVRLVGMKAAPTAAVPGTGGISFSNGTPVTLERSSGEPNLEIAPNGDMYVDIPLGAGTNSILFKSADNGQTFRPMAPLHPNNNTLSNNAAGGGDSGLAIEPDGRMCFSELNTLLSLGIGCSNDGGRTWTPSDPLIIDPTTPLVDRQWQAATPQGEQFISAQFGIITAGPSAPGIRAFKEVEKTGQFIQVAEVDTGEAMKSYNMAADPSDRDANGGTIVQAYLRSNKGPNATAAPHQLMIWRSTDGGETVNTYKVADLPTTPGNNFASVAIDRAGNIYVAWTEQGTWDVFYSVARKSNPAKWTRPVRVNADPVARTSIQPTIKVGDRGRVFIGYYGAEQYGNPDKLAGGVWHAYLAVSTNGACMLDARPCKAPAFRQVRVTDHPVQHRGICLGGTGCGGDPYHGDRSMLEYLDIEFTPSTGQAHVVVTDSSRAQGDTTITLYHQTGGPSAYNGTIRSSARRIAAGATVVDAYGDAIWPYELPVVEMASADGADITRVKVTRPNASTMRFTIGLADASLAALDDGLLAGYGPEMLLGVRFATDYDVMWAGLVHTASTGSSFAAGHLENGFPVDSYTADESIAVTGRVDETHNEVTIELPVAALQTTMQAPEGQTGRRVRAVTTTTPLYAVTAFSFVSPTTYDDPFVPKRLMDIAPAFTLLPARR